MGVVCVFCPYRSKKLKAKMKKLILIGLLLLISSEGWAETCFKIKGATVWAQKCYIDDHTCVFAGTSDGGVSCFPTNPNSKAK